MRKEYRQQDVVVEIDAEAILHCSIMQATVTNAFLDERKLQNFHCPAVAHVRGETDLAFKIQRPDSVACFAEMLACMQIQMSSSKKTFQHNPLPHNRVVSVVAESEPGVRQGLTVS